MARRPSTATSKRDKTGLMSVYQKLRRLPAIGGRRPSRIAVYACQMRFLMTRVALTRPELVKAKSARTVLGRELPEVLSIVGNAL